MCQENNRVTEVYFTGTPGLNHKVILILFKETVQMKCEVIQEMTFPDLTINKKNGRDDSFSKELM